MKDSGADENGGFGKITYLGSVSEQKEQIVDIKTIQGLMSTAFPELAGCQSIDYLTGIAEEILSKNYGQGRNPGERKDLCTVTADIIHALSETSGSWEAEFPEVFDLNTFRGVGTEDSFGDHTPVVLINKNDGKRYIVDLTFCQLIDHGSGHLVYSNFEGDRIDSGIDYRESPIAMKLLKNCYLGFEGMTGYLNLTVKAGSQKIDESGFWEKYYGEIDNESFDDTLEDGYREIERYLKEIMN